MKKRLYLQSDPKPKGRVIRVSKDTGLKFKRILLYLEESNENVKADAVADGLFAMAVNQEFEKIV